MTGPIVSLVPPRPLESLASRLQRELRDFDPVVRLAALGAKLEATAFQEVETPSGAMQSTLVNDVAAQLAVAAYAKVASYIHPAPVAGAVEPNQGINAHATEAARRLIDRIDRLTDAVRGSGQPLGGLVRACQTAADCTDG